VAVCVAGSSRLRGRLADAVDALVAAALGVGAAGALGLDAAEDEEEAEGEGEGTEDDGVHLQRRGEKKVVGKRNETKKQRQGPRNQ